MTVGNHTLPTEILRTCDSGMLWCFANWASVVTEGAFWVFLLAGFCIVLTIATSRLGMTRAFGYGSFVGMLGGIWFAVMGLIPWYYATIFILVGVIGMGMMIMSEK